jgi:hypothetical protein
MGALLASARDAGCAGPGFALQVDFPVLYQREME